MFSKYKQVFIQPMGETSEEGWIYTKNNLFLPTEANWTENLIFSTVHGIEIFTPTEDKKLV